MSTKEEPLLVLDNKELSAKIMDLEKRVAKLEKEKRRGSRK